MLALVLLIACFEVDTTNTAPTSAPLELPAQAPSTPPASAEASSLQGEMLARPLDITRHGACRMDCRKIDQGEAMTVLREGTLDPSRTRTDGPCPSHAIEGTGTDGHRLRVVFAECRDETRLVTAIDLDQDWPCDCD